MFHERKPSVRWVLPEGQYNPVVADGVRWLDYERAADPTREDTQTEPHDDSHEGPQGEPQGDSREGSKGEPHGDSREGSRDDPRDDSYRELGGGLFDGLVGAAVALERADWFDREQRPPRLADSRPYGVPGGLAKPDPQVERDLAEALRPGVRFPDPRGTWVRLVNGGGPADDPFRATNAADCALAVMSTWHGEPAAAAPRMPEYDRIGRPVLTGEQGSVARIEGWVGQRLQYAGQGRHAYPLIARRLLDAGHGAGAVIVVRWPGGGSHAWNAVNANGEVIWIDAQRGHMSVEPPYRTVTGVFCVILDRQGRPR